MKISAMILSVLASFNGKLSSPREPDAHARAAAVFDLEPQAWRDLLAAVGAETPDLSPGEAKYKIELGIATKLLTKVLKPTPFVFADHAVVYADWDLSAESRARLKTQLRHKMLRLFKLQEDQVMTPAEQKLVIKEAFEWRKRYFAAQNGQAERIMRLPSEQERTRRAAAEEKLKGFRTKQQILRGTEQRIQVAFTRLMSLDPSPFADLVVKVLNDGAREMGHFEENPFGTNAFAPNPMLIGERPATSRIYPIKINAHLPGPDLTGNWPNHRYLWWTKAEAAAERDVVAWVVRSRDATMWRLLEGLEKKGVLTVRLPGFSPKDSRQTAWDRESVVAVLDKIVADLDEGAERYQVYVKYLHNQMWQVAYAAGIRDRPQSFSRWDDSGPRGPRPTPPLTSRSAAIGIAGLTAAEYVRAERYFVTGIQRERSVILNELLDDLFHRNVLKLSLDGVKLKRPSETSRDFKDVALQVERIAAVPGGASPEFTEYLNYLAAEMIFAARSRCDVALTATASARVVMAPGGTVYAPRPRR